MMTVTGGTDRHKNVKGTSVSFPLNRRKTSTMVRSAVQYLLQQNAVLLFPYHTRISFDVYVFMKTRSLYLYGTCMWSCLIIYLYFWVIVLRMNAVCLCIDPKVCVFLYMLYIYINVYLLCCLYKMVWLCRFFRWRFVDRYGQQRKKKVQHQCNAWLGWIYDSNS